MKKILIIQESLGGGGAEKVLCSVLNKFDYSKYDVTLLLWHKSGFYLDKIPEKVRVIGIFDSKCGIAEKILFRLPGILGDYMIGKQLKRTPDVKGHYDAIISFLEGVSARIHSRLLSSGDKNVTWVHIDMERNRWSNKYFSYKRAESFYSQVDDVVFVSNGAKSAFERIFKTTTRHRVIYNIQDKEEIIRLGNEALDSLPENRFSVCCVGRLVRQKRFDRVIRVASILKARGYDVLFRIIGSGNLKDELADLAKASGVEDMIEFVGFQSNPYKYIKASDVFLLTSESEGFSLVVAEAMILGKPVISTTVAGPTELIGDGEGGILCNEDEEEIADAVMSFYDDEDLIKRYSLAAYNRSKIFNQEEIMGEIYSLI